MGRWILLIAVALLPHCRASRTTGGAPPESPATSASGAAEQWSAAAALETCEDALNDALEHPPESRRANALMVSCTSLIRRPACRRAMADQVKTPGATALRESLFTCAKEYCDGPARSRLAACTTPLPSDEQTLRDAWVDLRRAMVIDDFTEPERALAAGLLLGAARYVAEVPPPAVHVKEPASRINLQINPNGSILVEREGRVLGTVAATTALSRLLPRCLDADAVSIAASADVEHATVIMLMDELRSLGCDDISFSARR